MSSYLRCFGRGNPTCTKGMALHQQSAGKPAGCALVGKLATLDRIPEFRPIGKRRTAGFHGVAATFAGLAKGCVVDAGLEALA
jgi:hypothetical protein